MKHAFFTLFLLCSFIFICQSKEHPNGLLKDQIIKSQGIERTYTLYLPKNMPAKAPLIIVLHGYGGNTNKIQPLFNKLSQEYGFAVCYPKGSNDKRGKSCWNVGYPFQDNMKINDVKYLKQLVRHLQKKYDLSAKNTFCTGMSNGGEMCYLLAFTSPDVFRAVAPIAGLTMQWFFEKYQAKKPMPLLEVHGTKDHTSEWFGDLENKGHWGEYLPVPIAVGYWAAANKCIELKIDTIPTLHPENGHKVVAHKYSRGIDNSEVWLYEVINGSHSWATDDIDTPALIWEFFSKYIE